MTVSDGDDVAPVPLFGAVTFIDDTTIPGETYLYSISAIDAFWNESDPSAEITVTIPN